MKPSPNEFQLLKALWSSSPASAREIHDFSSSNTQWSMSSTRKTLDRMVEKGMIAVEERHGLKLYSTNQKKLTTVANFIGEFARKVLELDGRVPASAFAGSRLLDDEELAELQLLLDEQTKDDEEAK